MEPASQIIFLTVKILKSSPGIELEVLNVFDFDVFLFLNTYDYVQYQEHLAYLIITLTALRSTGTQESRKVRTFLL